MRERANGFYSDGLRLDAALYLPDHDPGQSPVVIACSGFTGLRDIHPARFARALCDEGYPFLTFDYRGFRDSEGEPGRVVLDEQVADIVSAAGFARGEPALADRPLVLLGWGMAGGLILQAAPVVPNLAGLIACNGFYDALAVQRAVRGAHGYAAFRHRLDTARTQAAHSGIAPRFGPFEVYPLDEQSSAYVHGHLHRNPRYGLTSVGLAFADSLLRFYPLGQVDRLDGLPLLIVHGRANRLHPPEQAARLHDRYPGPSSLCWLDGAGHTEFMLDEHPVFHRMVGHIRAWLAALPVASAA